MECIDGSFGLFWFSFYLGFLGARLREITTELLIVNRLVRRVPKRGQRHLCDLITGKMNVGGYSNNTLCIRGAHSAPTFDFLRCSGLFLHHFR